MTDISVIILIGQEKIHLKRCVEKLAPLNPRQIFLVESQPDDGGVALAKETAAKYGLRLESKFNKWPGNQAIQFNWALDNLPIEAEWILRLDADEYLYPETCEEMKQLVTSDGLPQDVTSLSLSRARCFCGRELHFTKNIVLVRAFRRRFGRSSQSEMDEHIVTTSGKTYHLHGKFVDDSLMSMDEWREKHRNYARREARMAVTGCANANKRFYYKLPPYFRAFAYFSIRYFLKGGFLDGYSGWMWHFWQGLWYRWIVDREIARLRRESRD